MLASGLGYLCIFHLARHFTYFTAQVLFLQFARAGEHFSHKRRHAVQCYNVLQNCDSSATTTQDPPGGPIGSQRDVGDWLLLLLCCLLLRFTFDDKLLPYLTVVANKCYGSVETAWCSITTASSKKQTNIALHSFREVIRLITRSSFYKYFFFFCFSSQSTAPYSSSVGGDNVYGSWFAKRHNIETGRGRTTAFLWQRQLSVCRALCLTELIVAC